MLIKMGLATSSKMNDLEALAQTKHVCRETISKLVVQKHRETVDPSAVLFCYSSKEFDNMLMNDLCLINDYGRKD